METFQPFSELVKAATRTDWNDEEESAHNPEKDDMMARRTGSYQKPVAAKTNPFFNQFLPVPGSVKYNVAPVYGAKQTRLKISEKIASERYFLWACGLLVSDQIGLFVIARSATNCG